MVIVNTLDERQFRVYMMASRVGGTIYVGMTSRLLGRTWEHREGVVSGFTRRHGVHRLVWFEEHGTAESALLRKGR